MGACASVSKSSDSSLRFELGTGSSKDRKHFASPLHTDAVKQQKSGRLDLNCSSFGSKDEAFFDSKPWLDSDNEDDFFSVRGDLTPAGGTSPPNNQINTSRSNEPSPRMNLAQLLLEGNRSDEEEEHQRDPSSNLSACEKKPEESADDTSKLTSKSENSRTSKSLNCCLPSVVSNFQFHEKKKDPKQDVAIIT